MIRFLRIAGAVVVGLGIIGGLRLGWLQHEDAVTRAHALALLRAAPAASSYGKGALTDRGATDGFQTRVVAAVRPLPNPTPTAQAFGNLVLTYTGNAPPTLASINVLATTQHSALTLYSQSFRGLEPIQLSAHRYVYWVSGWTQDSPFDVSRTRQAFRDSVVWVALSSGRSIRITQQPTQ
ncbi:hypothetical protein [Sulfobacillus harzensis]|uniref:Uncharacterized protein n=1 Tax=Sulfobacillus harzensis TaxID=2729629 RepID=A0A7Y0Q4D9_9FIRM|nr:hypothetical protein [Sulfobacillus harzensis]NMP23149.1 hypothetical protein [Sulfobacillus harzensis]